MQIKHSMIVRFLYRIIHHHSYLEAFKYSIASGSASAFSSELASAEEIYNLYKTLRKDKKRSSLRTS